MKQQVNFLLFWGSQSLSQLGSAMSGFALILWVYRQTGSAMTTSLLTFFSYLPMILASTAAGPQTYALWRPLCWRLLFIQLAG